MVKSFAIPLLSGAAIVLAGALIYVRSLPPVTLEPPPTAGNARMAGAFDPGPGAGFAPFEEEALFAALEPPAPAPVERSVLDPEQCTDDPLPDLEEARQQLIRDSGVLAGTFGTPRTGQIALRQKLPVMPGAYAVSPVGDELQAYGLPMNVLAFEIQRRPEQVLEYYAHHFEERGWPWTGLADTAKVVPYPAITATEPAEQIQLSVMVMPHADESGSTVILGLADMLAGAKNALQDELADLPRYPGTEPLAVRSRDEATHSLSVSFKTEDPPETVAQYYRQELAQLGYQEIPSELGSTDELKTLRFAASGRQWSLTITGYGGETAVTALTSLAEVLP